MANCDACGADGARHGIGGALLCRTCSDSVSEEINALRAAGKQANALTIARRIYRETCSAGSYLMRDIPDELWQRAKHRAVDDKVSLRDLIIAALRAYLGER